jgi:hypothetical protein
MKSIQCATVIAVATLALTAVSLRARDRIPVKVVVVATFDNELQNWYPFTWWRRDILARQ